MNPELLQGLTTILSITALIISSIASILWSRKYRSAKDAEVKAKIAQMDAIREKADIYESIVSKNLLDYSKQTIKELEQHLEKTEKLHDEKVKKIINDYKELEQELEQVRTPNNGKPKYLELFSKYRTPINAILGLSDLYMLGHSTQQERDEYVFLIRNSATDLLEIIDEYKSLRDK